MDIQTIIVIVVAALAAWFLIKRFRGVAKGRSDCGCGCGSSDCPEAKRNCCSPGKDERL